MTNILHTSDLHGNYKKLLAALEGDFDVWVDTGDFFPNKTRGDRSVEVPFQAKWAGWKNLGERIVEGLAGRPLISVGGNHDYISLAALVRDAGGTAFDVSEGPAQVSGLTFAGFREIPWIAGEWNGETLGPDFTAIVEETFAANPDILVTPGPAAGLLDDKAHGGGVVQLASALTWQPHNVKAHFFGHIQRGWGGYHSRRLTSEWGAGLRSRSCFSFEGVSGGY